tara:strand:+ start:442208 stop:442417 length:210 start_codon:yes stop_codon:yes gene_type:complete
MCIGGSPKAPAAPKPPPAVVTQEEQAVVDSRDRERLRRQRAAGQSSTILTGSEGVTTDAPVTKKTLLGQ